MDPAARAHARSIPTVSQARRLIGRIALLELSSGSALEAFPKSVPVRYARCSTSGVLRIPAPPRPVDRTASYDHRMTALARAMNIPLDLGLVELTTRPICASLGLSSGAQAIDPARRVLVLELEAHRPHVRPATDGRDCLRSDFDFFRVLFRVLFGGFLRVWLGGSLTGEVIHRSAADPVPRARNLIIMARAPHRRRSVPPAPARWRPDARPPPAHRRPPKWILAQRAIWFRFDPIRASSRVRSRSKLGVRDRPGPHPAHRPPHQIRQR